MLGSRNSRAVKGDVLKRQEVKGKRKKLAISCLEMSQAAAILPGLLLFPEMTWTVVAHNVQ